MIYKLMAFIFFLMTTIYLWLSPITNECTIWDFMWFAVSHTVLITMGIMLLTWNYPKTFQDKISLLSIMIWFFFMIISAYYKHVGRPVSREFWGVVSSVFFFINTVVIWIKLKKIGLFS